MKDRNTTINVDGGQVNIAEDNAVMNIIQNNGFDTNELDNIIKDIMENLSSLEKEEADQIREIVDMTKEEVAKSEPQISRLRNCVTLIAPIITIANGIPALVNNLQMLADYIMAYIK